jgi:pimeloyl-ACP methyl ester carboxylesterase
LPNGAELFFYDKAPIEGDNSQPKQKPALILIHGLGDEADSWRHLIPRLNGAGFRTIAPDLPGFGRSSPKGKLSINGHAETIIALIDAAAAASPENPAVLVGSSMGAVIAEAVAFKRPDLVKALALIDGCFPLSGGINKGLLLMGLPFIGKRWYRAFRKDREGAWKSLYPYYHDLEGMDETDKVFLRERVIARVESGNQERAYFASLRSLNRLSLFGKAGFSFIVKKFPGQILLIWGSEDHVLPEEQAREIRLIRPDAIWKNIEGAGHLPHQESPEKTAKALIQFLERL